MTRKSLCLAFAIMSFIVIVRHAGAQCSNESYSYVADWWKLAEKKPCENWNGKKEFKCEPADGAAVVTIHNNKDEDIWFTFHDRNGKVVTYVKHAECFRVPKKGSRKIKMLSIQGSKHREAFILGCENESGKSVNCQDYLSADVSFYIGNLQ